MTGARVRQLWRYPVKSMGGEKVQQLVVGRGAVVGDRAYGLLEVDSGRLVSAKRHGAMLGCRARYLASPTADRPAPPVEVEFPDGTAVSDDTVEISRRVSALLEHDVRLIRHRDPEAAPVAAMAAPDTLADFAPVHVLAGGDLDRLARDHPVADWDPRRFRPNVLIDGGRPDSTDDWLGCDIHLGDEAVVHAVMHTSRCVMTTHAQAGMAHDSEVLRILASVRRREVITRGGRPCVGCYAEVVTPGVVCSGDAVHIERVEPRQGVLAAALDRLGAQHDELES